MGVHMWQTSATVTTSVPQCEPVSELWGQFFWPHGSMRPYIMYISKLGPIYSLSPLQTSALIKTNVVKCDMRPWFSCPLVLLSCTSQDFMVWLDLHCLPPRWCAKFLEMQKSWKINTNYRCQSRNVKHIHQCNIVKRNLGGPGETPFTFIAL